MDTNSNVCIERTPVEVVGAAAKIRLTPDGRMSLQDTATYLGVSVHALYAWGNSKPPLRQVRLGRHISYFKSDVDAFLKQATGNGEVA